MELPKHYKIKESEEKWQKAWEDNKTYAFDPESDMPLFRVDTPPPTVSGQMHLGHALMYSQMDYIVRYKRMKGFNVFYPFGTDDNGLATERLIEKLEKVRSKRMARQDFIDLCIKKLNDIRPGFVKDWKNVGISCDYNIFYSTINNHCRRISQRSFIELYKKGREYRKEAPIMWCPECQTAIAQVELEDKEFDSYFNDVIFKSEEGDDLIISTTRPEYIPACVALFYHPDDERYKHLAGKSAIVPLFDYKVPLMSDESVDSEKGTGLMMVCTFGDQEDVEKWIKYNLPLRKLITKNGRLTELGGKYENMKTHEARKEIIEDLKAAGHLIKQKSIKHVVKVHERCGHDIEFINSLQWFIRYLDLREEFLKAGNQLKWHPDFMAVRLENWIKGLKWDWCISRQRYFGIPFPVWYCKDCGEIIMADTNSLPVDPLKDKPPVENCPKCGSKEFEPEKDVLDTWATSSLTPEIAAELFPEIKDRLFPMDLRPQAHDIITFWLFNTLVKSQLHHGVNPWKDVMISGFVLDPHGNKMSKSKGNVVQPQVVIDKYGADCLRFWASSSKLGEDMPYQEKDLITGKKFITKLWNASKFAIMNLEGFTGTRPETLTVVDRWILSKMHQMIRDATEAFDNFEYSKAKTMAEHFFWSMICDNYLEIIKDRIYNPAEYGPDAKLSAQYTLYQLILNTLKLMAPITPFITEEIYHMYFREFDGHASIHTSSWPKVDEVLADAGLDQLGETMLYIIESVRRFKSDNNMSLKERIKCIEIFGKVQPELMAEVALDIKSVTKAEEIIYKQGDILQCDISN